MKSPKQILCLLSAFIFSLATVNCVPKKSDFNDTLVLLAVVQSVLTAQQVASAAATAAAVSPACSTPGIPTDPLFANQWHLLNNGTTTGSVTGEDAKASSAWNLGCKGNGVNIVTVDDGMDTTHEDLTSNYLSTLSINFSSDSTDRGFAATGSCNTTANAGCHGTAVSGIMAARDGNNIGLVGIAPRDRKSVV